MMWLRTVSFRRNLRGSFRTARQPLARAFEKRALNALFDIRAWRGKDDFVFDDRHVRAPGMDGGGA
jgi:hypothetical protein